MNKNTVKSILWVSAYWLSLCLCVGVGLVFLAAGLHKVQDLKAFADAISPMVGDRLSAVGARLTVGLELVVGGFLMLNQKRLTASVIGIVVSATFVVYHLGRLGVVPLHPCPCGLVNGDSTPFGMFITNHMVGIDVSIILSLVFVGMVDVMRMARNELV